MRRILMLLALATLATAAFAAAETIDLPDGTTMEVHYPGVDGVSRPVAKPNDRVVPQYPALASPVGAESTVVFSVLVDADGSPVQLVVRDATHPGLGFEDAAADALFRWEFEPATLDGAPVASYANVRVRFPKDAPRARSGFVGGFPRGAAGGGASAMDAHSTAMRAATAPDVFGAPAAAANPGTDGQARPSSSGPPPQTLTRATVPNVAEGQIYFRGHPEWGYRIYNGPLPGEDSSKPR